MSELMIDHENQAEHEAHFLSVLPLKNVVALPKSIIPVVVGRESSIKAVDFALTNNKEIFLTTQKKADIESPTPDDIFHFGTRAHILQVARMPNGSLKILVEGILRSRITQVTQTDGFMGVLAEDLPSDPLENTPENKALWRNLYLQFKTYIGLNDKISKEVLTMFKELKDLDYLADTIAVQMRLDFSERQKILETVDLKERVLKLSIILQEEIEILQADKSIRKRVQSQVEKNQKDYYLNEQMRAIQRELGKEDHQNEVNELRKKAKKLKLTQEAAEKVEAECNRLEQMQSSSPEAAVSKNYIDWLLQVPWSKATKDSVSLEDAQKILDKSHASMKKAKDRIIEFLAAKKFAKSKLKRSPIICLVGPPGVGKTSLAQSVADSLGRKMARISLGGMRDEAEIRGHRRTYIGALPGKIIQAMKKVGVVNPVIVLDEIDKMAMDFRGDPASALLEVLDPEQNKNFSDYFLEVEYDLSQVMFITTANVMDAIPYPLLDRMEVISLSGYTEKEKAHIAQAFLLPKLLKEHALKASQVVIDDECMATIIDEYTKEAGVRQLERVLAKVIRKAIQDLLLDDSRKKVAIDKQTIIKWLGNPKFKKPDLNQDEHVGLSTGLAWTEVGGDVLEIEVTLLKGKGGLSLTGQLGEVMQESAQAALSYIRSRAKELGIKESFYNDYDIHIHIPEGAIPKDGPSAGITIALALISALTKIPVKSKLAMTGEITLRGRVLPVGGLKEKLLAAHRLGFTKVIAPKENMNDIKEFEADLDGKVDVVYAASMEEVLAAGLTKMPEPKTRKKTVRKKAVSGAKRATA